MVTHLNVQMTFQSEPLQFNFQEEYFQTDVAGVMQSDFELVGGLIFLNANLEGESQPFILDTGSPHLLLNSKLSKKKKNTLARLKIVLINLVLIVWICLILKKSQEKLMHMSF